MPTIMINWLEGKSDEVKRNVVRDITKVIQEDVGVDPVNVRIVINDLKSNQFAQGGILAMDTKK